MLAAVGFEEIRLQRHRVSRIAEEFAGRNLGFAIRPRR